MKNIKCQSFAHGDPPNRFVGFFPRSFTNFHVRTREYVGGVVDIVYTNGHADDMYRYFTLSGENSIKLVEAMRRGPQQKDDILDLGGNSQYQYSIELGTTTLTLIQKDMESGEVANLCWGWDSLNQLTVNGSLDVTIQHLRELIDVFEKHADQFATMDAFDMATIPGGTPKYMLGFFPRDFNMHGEITTVVDIVYVVGHSDPHYRCFTLSVEMIATLMEAMRRGPQQKVETINLGGSPGYHYTAKLGTVMLTLNRKDVETGEVIHFDWDWDSLKLLALEEIDTLIQTFQEKNS